MSNFKSLIEKAEIAREKEQDTKALEILDKVILKAGIKKDYNTLLSALSHKLLVWKHAYLKTRDNIFLELMLTDAKLGLKIYKLHKNKIDKDLAAIMYLRIGHYYQYRHKFDKALSSIKKSLNLINKNDKNKYGEHLGHYGLGLALNNNKQGIKILLQALDFVSKSKSLRPFHKLVIHSGILLRLTLAYKKFNQPEKAAEFLDTAGQIGLVLNKKYKLPIRLWEARQIKADKLNIF